LRREFRLALFLLGVARAVDLVGAEGLILDNPFRSEANASG